MTNKWRGLFLTIGATVLMAAQAQAASQLLVYTAMEADDIKRYSEAFGKAHPDIELNFARDSTGVITAKLLAERNNPKADVIWGLAATSLLILKAEGMLQAYSPGGVEALKPAFVDKDTPPSWVGMDAWSASVCFNSIEGAKLGIEAPTSWKDLLKPEYRGRIAMPNPASSGTGYLYVASWLQLFGEDAGWAYMDGLHENVSLYTHSGSKPCKMAAAGEALAGLSFEFRAARLKEEGAPLEIVIPTEGIGWDMEASAIMAGTPNAEAAQTLIDWSISEEANKMYNVGYAIVARPDIAKPIPHLPANIEDMLIDNDLEWAANNRRPILDEWQTRYGSKSEPAQ